MTIVNEIQRIENNIANSYVALEEKGATLPTNQNSDNLASTIANLEIGGGSDELLKSIVEATATEIVLPENIEKIAKYFFYDSSNYPFSDGLTSFKANGIKEVGAYGMAGHRDSMTTIELPNVEVIGNYGLSTLAYAFSDTTLTTKIKLGKLKSIGNKAFNGLFNPATTYNQEVEMSFNDCVIGTNAFAYYNLYSFDGTGIKSIGTQPFHYCGNDFRKIWLPKTIETISATTSSSGYLIRFNNAYSTTSVTIYTDVASEEEVPSGWADGWNYPTTYVTTVYGATYEDFLNA